METPRGFTLSLERAELPTFRRLDVPFERMEMLLHLSSGITASVLAGVSLSFNAHFGHNFSAKFTHDLSVAQNLS